MSATISYLSSSQVGSVVAISDDRFGFGYLLHSDFTSPDAVTLVATVDEAVVGFALFHIIPPSGFPDALSVLYPESHTSVLFKTIAIKTGYEDKGIGNLLFAMVLNIARNQGALCCYSYMWDKSDNNAIWKLAVNHGFVKVADLPQFWYEESLQKGYQCVVCGNPCSCNATLICRPFVRQ